MVITYEGIINRNIYSVKFTTKFRFFMMDEFTKVRDILRDGILIVHRNNKIDWRA